MLIPPWSSISKLLYQHNITKISDWSVGHKNKKKLIENHVFFIYYPNKVSM